MLEWDNCPRKRNCFVFVYYSPEQFYMINKLIIVWTKKNYKKENRFIFINAWNEWGEGSYLEPDNKFGYASINSLSKTLFNLSFMKIKNLINLNKTRIILVQINICYENLIKNIINNIPVKFDLFISINTKIESKYIGNYIKNNSKASNYEIRVFPNKENDVLLFLKQVTNHIKKYKYYCHIYSKNSIHLDFVDEWRNYLYNNLLGNRNIISEILTEFENSKNLGLIYPETFYLFIKFLHPIEKIKIICV